MSKIQHIFFFVGCLVTNEYTERAPTLPSLLTFFFFWRVVGRKDGSYGKRTLSTFNQLPPQCGTAQLLCPKDLDGIFVLVGLEMITAAI